EARLVDASPACDGHRRAERGVTGEGQLLARGPDPVAVVGPVRLGTLHERRLGETHLPGEGEHPVLAHAVSMIDQGEAVHGERTLREDVEPGEPMLHADMIAIAVRQQSTVCLHPNEKGETWTRATQWPTRSTIPTGTSTESPASFDSSR